MKVSIRPDHCIALRLIDAQEHYRKAQDWLNMVPEWERLVEVASQSQAIIKMQAAEIEKLRHMLDAETDQARKDVVYFDELRAENEKLRAALKQIAETYNKPTTSKDGLAFMAATALKETGE